LVGEFLHYMHVQLAADADLLEAERDHHNTYTSCGFTSYRESRKQKFHEGIPFELMVGSTSRSSEAFMEMSIGKASWC
jgi:hypothetical protein